MNDYKKMSLHELFDYVFDENQCVRACGREACKCLIQKFEDLSPDVDFGNTATGIMNTKNMFTYVSNVMSLENPCASDIEQSLFWYAG